MCCVYMGILELYPRTVLALCLGMIVSAWLVDALRLRSLGVGIVGLASALVKMPSRDALSIKRADASWRACPRVLFQSALESGEAAAGETKRASPLHPWQGG